MYKYNVQIHQFFIDVQNAYDKHEDTNYMK